MALPAQNILAWKVCIELLHVFAIFSTIYRLLYRWKIRRLWWDDYLVVIPLLVDCVYSTLALIRYQNPKPSLQDQGKPIYSYWLSTFLFLIIIWFTRIVLSLSLARVFPENHKPRRIGISLAILFGLTFVSAILVTTLTCDTIGFALPKDPHCVRGVNGYTVKALYLPISDYCSDLAIIICSITLLWRIKLRPGERFLVLAVFSASILTLLSAIVFTVASFSNINLGPNARFLFGQFASLEVAISLIVCNLAIVVTGIYRLFRKEPTTAPPRTEFEISSYNPSLQTTLPSNLTFTDVSSPAQTNTQSSKDQMSSYYGQSVNSTINT